MGSEREEEKMNRWAELISPLGFVFEMLETRINGWEHKGWASAQVISVAIIHNREATIEKVSDLMCDWKVVT